ncbi:hypothetical protein GWI33_021195 [Rhynchophorus ferrugineus]|uniref:Secreted protein n=1 Tax=Rhynchophorus ferrugineus TaxID=354439 RepID=A0A834HQZ0_RHYFE|nr:hypothetical protein GWI33_021195 [Rhynchophorus ferrugineus]
MNFPNGHFHGLKVYVARRVLFLVLSTLSPFRLSDSATVREKVRSAEPGKILFLSLPCLIREAVCCFFLSPRPDLFRSKSDESRTSFSKF